jgi:mRNA interferase MazF
MVEPSRDNGLVKRSQIMIDKAAAVPRAKIGQRIGRIETDTMRRVSAALTEFLELK